MGWQAEECKSYTEGSEHFFCFFVFSLNSNWTFTVQYWWVAIVVLFLYITGSFFFFFFSKGTLKKVRLKTNYLIWVGAPYHLSLISDSYLFLMENILSLLFTLANTHFLFTLANTHFRMSADCFSKLVGIFSWNWAWPFPNYLAVQSISFTLDCSVQRLKSLSREWNLLLFKTGSLSQKWLCRSGPHFAALERIMFKYLIWKGKKKSPKACSGGIC